MMQQSKKQPSAAPPTALAASLASIRAGQKVRLAGIEGGCQLQGRLLSLGLIRNACITVISNEGRGSLLIGLGESRMTIGRGMAEKILVR